MEVKFPEVKVKLVGMNGNAIALMGRVSEAMRKAKVAKPDIDAFLQEATRGDYDHLLQTCMKTVTVIS